MTQDEVDVFECLNSLLKVVSQMFNGDNLDCDVLDDEISTHIQGAFYSCFNREHLVKSMN